MAHESYKLTLHTGLIERTSWWKDENRKEPSSVWFIEGPGVNRLATESEVDLWQQVLAAKESRPAGRVD